MKKQKITIIYLLLLLVATGQMAFGQYVIDFEGENEHKIAYANGDLSLSGKLWNLNDVLVYKVHDIDEWANGNRSARLKGVKNTSMTMKEDKTNGLGTIRFDYKAWKDDNQVEWIVQYSTNQGVSWLQVGSSFTPQKEGPVKRFEENVNIAGNVRIRIITTSTAGTSTYRRLNIDDIIMTDYNMPPQISGIQHQPAPYIGYQNTVSVSATITDSDGSVTEAKLGWSTNSGDYSNTINMTAGSGNVYTSASNIPAQALGTTIYYRITAKDDFGNISTSTEKSYSITGIVAQDDFSQAMVDSDVEIDILSNDHDQNGAVIPSSVVVSLVSGTEPNPATEGTFSVNPNGTLKFSPVMNFIGEATVDYKVCDTNGQCDIATVTIEMIMGISNLYPAHGPGTLAFEDLWPGKGDYDFNDLVIDYQFEVISNLDNYVDKVIATFELKAFGAALENGFGFQLGNVNSNDLTVTGSQLTESFISLNGNGTEAGQSYATIIVFDNTFSHMENPGWGIGVNTTPDAAYVQPVRFTLILKFKPNTYLVNELDIAGFNPFLIVNKTRGHEVHLPYYKPTELADASLFGQWEDDSKPATGRYYVTENNLPWALNIYENFEYPIEKQDLLQVYLKFAEWANSGGTLFPDWYKNLPGYRNQYLIYQKPAN